MFFKKRKSAQSDGSATRETFGFDDLPLSHYQLAGQEPVRPPQGNRDTDAPLSDNVRKRKVQAVSAAQPEQLSASEYMAELGLLLSDQDKPRGSIRDFAAKLETIIGLTATFFIGFSPPVILAIGTLVLIVHGEFSWCLLAVVGLVVSGWLAGQVAGQAGRSLTTCYPELMIGHQIQIPEELKRAPHGFAVHLAMSLPQPHRLLRPIFGIWWLCHFAVGVVLSIAMHGWLTQQAQNPSIFTLVFPLAFHVAFMIAANIYLTICVAAMSRNEDVIAAVWRLRFSIDLVLTLLVAAISFGW